MCLNTQKIFGSEETIGKISKICKNNEKLGTYTRYFESFINSYSSKAMEPILLVDTKLPEKSNNLLYLHTTKSTLSTAL